MMNKKILLLTVFITLFMSLTYVEGSDNNLRGNFQSVPSAQIPDVLNMISSKIYDNYANIRTWQGKIDSNVSIIYNGAEAEKVLNEIIGKSKNNTKKIKKQRESTVEFVADFENKSYYTKKYHRSPLRYSDPNSGVLLKLKPIVSHNVAIVYGDNKITARAATKKGDSIRSRIAIKEKKAQKECLSGVDDIFDPRQFLFDGQLTWKTFELIIQFLKKNGHYSVGGHSLILEKRIKGSITDYRITIPGMVSPNEYLLKTMVFSSKVDFNMISAETWRSNGQPFQMKTWDYKKNNGVFVPQRTAKLNFQGEQADLSYKRESKFSNQKINQVIPEITFTYKNLGLKNGDHFADKILNEEYIYHQDGTLVKTKNIN